ncbi:MAG: phosphoglucosamine mutase [Bacteroidales bacterium]|nr:phosphoglucosamine mutase [Bacteroidales bacterium]MCL2133730.1 phosphoglucosamine mutase [Bacteroidales bacterium]
MPLITSISGIRGTVGGQLGEALTPIDAVHFAAGYAAWLRMQHPSARLKVVVGRDARISGPVFDKLVCGTLTACGVDVVNIGLAATPTVEMAVVWEKAFGGIILTASHNPKEWNALKLLNEKGEFLSAADGEALLRLVKEQAFEFVDVDRLGAMRHDATYTDKHIDAVCQHPLVDVEAIYKVGFKVVLDAVNSVGGVVIPKLLMTLGVQVVELYCEPDGRFPHNPEPLPEHLTEISKRVVAEQADCGIVVDPDVDRLALVCENGEMFGEEYTLVAVADYVLSCRKGNAVSNLSSSRALRDVAEKHGGQYFASAVGEVNVVAQMKACQAVIGGEGNGGVIVPDLHYGRDALIGIALFLSHLAHKAIKCSDLRAEYPIYVMSKNKVELTPDVNIEALLDSLKKAYSQYRITDIDGVRIDFDEDRRWVHLRRSNTEPIIRIYAEAEAKTAADTLVEEIKQFFLQNKK